MEPQMHGKCVRECNILLKMAMPSVDTAAKQLLPFAADMHRYIYLPCITAWRECLDGRQPIQRIHESYVKVRHCYAQIGY